MPYWKKGNVNAFGTSGRNVAKNGWQFTRNLQLLGVCQGEQVVMHMKCVLSTCPSYNYQNNQPDILFVNMVVTGTLPTGHTYVNS